MDNDLKVGDSVILTKRGQPPVQKVIVEVSKGSFASDNSYRTEVDGPWHKSTAVKR